jgi:hypothetical protein
MFILALYFLIYSVNAFLSNLLNSPLGSTWNNLLNSLGINIAPPGGFWTPPLTIFAPSPEVMFVFVSLGVMMLIPSAANIIKSMIERKPFSLGSAIGEPILFMGGRGFGIGEGILAERQSAASWQAQAMELGRKGATPAEAEYTRRSASLGRTQERLQRIRRGIGF